MDAVMAAAASTGSRFGGGAHSFRVCGRLPSLAKSSPDVTACFGVVVVEDELAPDAVAVVDRGPVDIPDCAAPEALAVL